MYWGGRKVLVIGGASFIGSHLVDRLVALGVEVNVADDLSSGKLENLASSIDDIEFLQGSLLDPAFAKQVYAGIEQVYHLATSHGGRGYIGTHQVEYASNTVLDGTVFAAAYKAGLGVGQTQVYRMRKLPSIGWTHTTGLMQIWQDYRRLAAKRVSVGKERH